MDMLWDGIRQAVELLFKLDPEVLEITLLSLRLSGIATLISLIIGIPLGTIVKSVLGHFFDPEYI